MFANNAQNKILNRMFRKVEGVVWDLSSNSIGLQNNQGITTLVQTPRVSESQTDAPTIDFSISVNPFDSFGFAIPAFAQLTKLEDIKVGDIVIGDTKALGWVTAVREKSLALLDQSGMSKNYTPPKVAVLNQDGALVVKPLTGLFGEQGAAGFGSALLPLMLAGGDAGLGDLGDVLPLLLLTQQTAGNNSNALASALPTILMMKSLKGGRGGMDNLLLPLILSGGLGGNGGGINPMMLLALQGGGLGGVQQQYIAGDVPALQQRPAQAPVGLQRLR